MLANVVFGAALIVVTTAVHSIATALTLRTLQTDRAARWERHTGTRLLMIGGLVLFMFFVVLLEVSIWASAFIAVGALPEIETALYFSMVTFTTLGYGDVVLPAGWRLLGSFEAANGTLMFGWTTAIIMALIHHLYLKIQGERDPGE